MAHQLLLYSLFRRNRGPHRRSVTQHYGCLVRGTHIVESDQWHLRRLLLQRCEEASRNFLLLLPFCSICRQEDLQPLRLGEQPSHEEGNAEQGNGRERHAVNTVNLTSGVRSSLVVPHKVFQYLSLNFPFTRAVLCHHPFPKAQKPVEVGQRPLVRTKTPVPILISNGRGILNHNVHQRICTAVTPQILPNRFSATG